MKVSQSDWEASVERVGIVAGCVIHRDGRYLLVQEKQEKVYGLWNLPAGYVDKGEEIEQAAVREAKEESGFDIELVRELGIFHESSKRPVKHIFEAHVTGGELKVQIDEILDVKWLGQVLPCPRPDGCYSIIHAPIPSKKKPGDIPYVGRLLKEPLGGESVRQSNIADDGRW